MAIPEKPSLDGIEAGLIQRWEADGTYRFDRSVSRDEVFAIDTPPPTVSGSLHVGHVFSYTHTDCVARFQRMSGKQVFYPIGWDDNGLATERRVQNFYGVRCDSTLPYDPDFTKPAKPDLKNQVPVSRPNFIELCKELVEADERAFEELFRRLGLSVDWTYLYKTIDDHCIRTSQQAFLKNLERGEAYSIDAPTLWDIDYKTAVAQAEMEDREQNGAYHKLAFHRTDGQGDVEIDTTRPELLASCVALVAHPDDERYQPLFGQVTVTTPLFGVEVPIVAHHLAEPDKGTGIAMICTFGDTTDVTWWRELQLPTRAVIQRDGRFQAATPDWITSDAGREAYAELAGKNAKQAQRRTAELLADSGELLGEPRPISHPVKFYERGDRPLEIVTSRQWYIRN
ncbi:MAG: class I tRNA ligase family protein, partial [Acidimicrobiales bacterium]|nr:class I tRNA ligase family protein [Acidimicrobiales bacterium]